MRLLDYVQIKSAKELAYSTPESSNGLYGWFLPTPKSKNFSDLSSVFEYLKDFSQVYGSEDLSGRRFSVTVKGKAADVQTGALTATEFQPYLQILPILSIFAPPLYVGYAMRSGGISERIKEHLKDSSFKKKLSQAIIDAKLASRVSPPDFSVIYFRFTAYCQDHSQHLDPHQELSVLRALERTAFRSYFPLLNSKEGN